MPEHYVDDFDVSFEELVLMYIFGDDIQYQGQNELLDDVFDAEENEDYLSLAEYYYSR